MAEVDDDDCGGGMLIWTVLLGVAPVVDDDILPLPVVLSYCTLISYFQF
jgi:hypothetical protein